MLRRLSVNKLCVFYYVLGIYGCKYLLPERKMEMYSQEQDTTKKCFQNCRESPQFLSFLHLIWLFNVFMYFTNMNYSVNDRKGAEVFTVHQILLTHKGIQYSYTSF